MPSCRKLIQKCNGTTLDGQSPFCCCPTPPPGCFTAPRPPPDPKTRACYISPRYPPKFKPGCYTACRPKNFRSLKYPCQYCPGPCTRPCCKHVPCLPCCKYDDPCKAHCYDHPEMLPSGRYPPNIFRCPLNKCC